jgi:hypothetical protein
MLMRNVSFTFPEKMVMTVHNRYLGIELASPVHFCNHGTYYEYSKRTDTGAMMKLDFRSDPDQAESWGILMYKVQRRGTIRSNQQSSTDTIYAKVIEEASKKIRLLITWKIKRSEAPKLNVMLVEHDNTLILNEDRLVKLHCLKRCSNVFSPFEHFHSSFL